MSDFQLIGRAPFQLHSAAGALASGLGAPPGTFDSSSAGGAVLPPHTTPITRRGRVKMRRTGGGVAVLTGPVLLESFTSPTWDGHREAATDEPRNRDGSTPVDFEWKEEGRFITDDGLLDIPVPSSFSVDVDPKWVRLRVSAVGVSAPVDVFYEPVQETDDL